MARVAIEIFSENHYIGYYDAPTWGVSFVSIKTNEPSPSPPPAPPSPPGTYVDRFNSISCDSVNWSVSATCVSCGTFGRLLKSPGSALDRNVTSLPLHNALTVELRLLKIDYWSYTSGDQFVVYVDDRVAYESGSSFYASASSNTRSECGNSDHEIELRASFVVEHDAATANIRVVAGETREFGLMSASIIASTIVAPSPAPTTFVQDAFIGGTVCDRRSWSGSMDCPHSCGNSMYHTTGTPELRVPNGGSLDKTIWNIPAHNVLILDFAFVKRGSWNGEEIRVHVDGLLMYTSERLYGRKTGDALVYYDSCVYGHSSGSWTVRAKLELNHTSASATIRISTSISSSDTSKWLGFESFNASHVSWAGYDPLPSPPTPPVPPPMAAGNFFDDFSSGDWCNFLDWSGASQCSYWWRAGEIRRWMAPRSHRSRRRSRLCRSTTLSR